MLTRVIAKHPVSALAVHFHDTQGTALANCVTAMQLGITTIDSAAGGLGGCPYEGDVDPRAVVDLTGKLHDMGVYQISISDTIGVANPQQVEDVLSRVLAKHPASSLAVHFHDTQGTALANCVVALTLGITTIDAAAGGLGGCPYAPGASGNLATEDVVAMLHGMGVKTGIDLDKLTEASRTAATFVGHELPSKYLKAHIGKQARARRRAELGG